MIPLVLNPDGELRTVTIDEALRLYCASHKLRYGTFRPRRMKAPGPRRQVVREERRSG